MERANQNSNAHGRGGNRPFSGRQLDPIRKNSLRLLKRNSFMLTLICTRSIDLPNGRLQVRSRFRPWWPSSGDASPEVDGLANVAKYARRGSVKLAYFGKQTNKTIKRPSIPSLPSPLTGGSWQGGLLSASKF